MPLRDALRVDVSLSEHTRKMSRNLLFCLLASTTIVALGFQPSSVGILNMNIENGHVSLPYAIAMLSFVFGFLGLEQWLHDKNSFNSRNQMRNLDIHKTREFIEHNDPDGVWQKSRRLVPESKEDLQGQSPNDEQSDEQSDEHQDRIKLYLNPKETFDGAMNKRKREKFLQSLQHFWLPAAVPFICLGLASIDPWLNPPPPAPVWVTGNYDQLQELFDQSIEKLTAP